MASLTVMRLHLWVVLRDTSSDQPSSSPRRMISSQSGGDASQSPPLSSWSNASNLGDMVTISFGLYSDKPRDNCPKFLTKSQLGAMIITESKVLKGLNLENKEREISDLYDLVRNCQDCPLYKLAKNPVAGAGSVDTEVMFIGEGPGEKEDELGLPFVGKAGKLLDEMLESIGLKRGDVYIANVVKHRPPGNRDPKPEEIEACWPHLMRQIKIIKPKLIVCLGRHSLARFLPDIGPISAVHGRAFKKKNQAYMALYHPAVGLYHGGMRDTLFKDFAKIKIALKKI